MDLGEKISAKFVFPTLVLRSDHTGKKCILMHAVV